MNAQSNLHQVLKIERLEIQIFTSFMSNKPKGPKHDG